MAGSFLYNGHLLAERWPEMTAKIKTRLLSEGKITKAMIESYVDAYARAYGDDTDAYVEEIVADTYAGMNRTDYGTNKLRADVKTEVGQWQKKSGSARAPPAKTQYSIKKDNKGQNYVDVPIWAMQIKNASEVGKALSDIVRKQFRSWVDVAGQKIGINQRTAGEWTFSKDAQRLYSKNKTAYADKVNAFGVAGELLQASRDYIGEQAKHFRKDNFREFARGKVSFKVGANGYEADIIVGTTTKGAAILYDMVNITPKKIAEAPNTILSAQNAEDRRQGTSARERISKTGETVKGKFSASARQAENDQTETEAFKDWFGDWQNDPESASKVVNADGTPKVMYRGGNETFNIFDRKKSKYSNLYGRGFYFTDSESHAKQYEDVRAYYLDVKNPVSTNEKTITRKQLRTFLEAVAENEDYGLENYGYGATVDSVLRSVYGKNDFAMLYDSKNKKSLSKPERDFSLHDQPNNTIDKHDVFESVHTWHPRDDSNVRPFA